MANNDLRELMQAEEAKRDRNWDPAERWRVILATIDWADQQQAVRRNTKEECLRIQAETLARMQARANKEPGTK